MRKALRVAMNLVVAFDAAAGAFNFEKLPGWDVASKDLDAALDAARDLGDVGGLPCPLGWWVSAQAQVRVWLGASPDVRRGLTKAVDGTIRTLSDYCANRVSVPEPVSDRRGG